MAKKSLAKGFMQRGPDRIIRRNKDFFFLLVGRLKVAVFCFS